MKILFILFILLYYPAFAAININSIIKLDNKNIPEECGLTFTSKTNDKQFNVSISIQKIKDSKDTLTKFEVFNSSYISSANLETISSTIKDIINTKNNSKTNFSISALTDQNKMSFFFQELLIGGGYLYIDNEKYEIKGPIDSKVRLEYLFCTGEMFLPNYESNQNE